MNKLCLTCQRDDAVSISTYKRFWRLCRECGTATPVPRARYPLAFMPQKDLKPAPEIDAQAMYDYFTQDTHIQYSIDDACDFQVKYLVPGGISVDGKRVLDLSGGNGHFVNELRRQGARVSLTEFNKQTVDYARRAHDFEAVYEYDMNVHELAKLVDGHFDMILARANIMFCLNLPHFVDQLRACLKSGGIVIVNNAVTPTLGVLVRVQLDEHSYSALRQPETIVNAFTAADFVLHRRHDETDQSMYVYDHDFLPYWMALHYYYEIRGARRLKGENHFAFRARDRRRSTLIFELPAG